VTNKDVPAAVSPLLSPYLEELRTCAALWGGTRAARAEGEFLLPRFPLEAQDTWRTRLATAVLPGVFARTIQQTVGLIVRDGVQFAEQVPPVFLTHWEDIDLAGTHGDRFTAQALAAALRDGLAFILIDAPAEGGRPYWVLRHRADVINWRHERVNGELVLVRAVVRETAIEPDGQFTQRVVTRYRVFTLEPQGVVVTVYREVQEPHEREPRYVVDFQTTLPLSAIPIVPLYAVPPDAPFIAHSPFLPLAYREAEYYQTYSDYKYNLHLACVAILTAKGIPEGETLRIAPSAVALLQPEQSLEYVEISGAGIGSAASALDRIEREMQGLSLAIGDTKNRTATEAVHLHTMRTALLRDAAQSCRDALENCLWWHLTLLGLPTDGIADAVQIGTELDATTDWTQALPLLESARRAGDLDLETYLEALEQSGALPAGVTPAVVLERLANQWGGSSEENQAEEETEEA